MKTEYPLFEEKDKLFASEKINKDELIFEIDKQYWIDKQVASSNLGLFFFFFAFLNFFILFISLNKGISGDEDGEEADEECCISAFLIQQKLKEDSPFHFLVKKLEENLENLHHFHQNMEDLEFLEKSTHFGIFFFFAFFFCFFFFY